MSKTNTAQVDKKLTFLIILWILDKLAMLAMFYWFD